MGGLLGVGGGFIMLPLQVLWTRLSQRQANANSLAAVLAIAVAGLLVYLFGTPRPQVDLRFALLLIVGGTGGAFVGARLALQVSERNLRMAVAVLLALVGLRELVLG
jgi:uncharacterized membrane protein YfcA